MNPSVPTVSAEEQEQIVQTIEMFEVIVQANPQDCQSMEILKDAYQRIGRAKETLGIARKLAETYMALGQFSSSLLEYEGILSQDPDNPEIIAALGEVEERMHSAGAGRAFPSADASSMNLDFRADIVETEISTLMATDQTVQSGIGSGARAEDVIAALKEDGNGALAKFLVQYQLVSEEIVSSCLERVQKKNRELAPNTCASSLLEEIVGRGAADLPALLCGILDRSKFAYIPLDCYDIDRQIVKMLPESITLGRLIVPFDLISRTMMIATANPFDMRGKEAVQQVLDYNIQWHLAEPSAITKVLLEAYRIPSSSGAMKLA